MIRVGKAMDAPELTALLSRTCDVSRYGGAVSVDPAIARKLFAQAAMKHGFIHDGGMFLMVSEDETGAIDMFILGALSRIYMVCDMLAASDLFLVHRDGAKPNPRALVDLVDAYLAWADSNPKVYEIGLSWSDTLPGAERLTNLFKRRGFQRCGETWRRDAFIHEIEEAA